MTNFRVLKQLRPAYAEMADPQNTVHRGEAIVFRPNRRSPFHSTDAGGFRHSTCRGETLSVAEILKRARFGILLGSSHTFGLGVPGNENTIASLLGEHFGFPFANVSMPEGNSRNLFSLLAAQLAVAPKPPAVVVVFNGGDFTSFCLSSIIDSVFGSPNLKQFKAAMDERGGYSADHQSMEEYEAFSGLWTHAIIDLCRESGIPLVFGRDTTFFEKQGSTEFERHCGIGTAFNDIERRWFETHHKHHARNFEIRERRCAELGIPLAGPAPPTDLTFLDEFHYDRAGTHVMFEHVAQAVEPMLAR